ncbi:MAG: hypothetical protein SFU25_08575 [Candidatus Caenarcaniphilales bacterium]|nr:hypothetical protein [Candidatus Caenarcaniphilales bacterium]
MKKLKKENARLKEENEILKKASANEAKRKLKPLPLMQPANA